MFVLDQPANPAAKTFSSSISHASGGILPLSLPISFHLYICFSFSVCRGKAIIITRDFSHSRLRDRSMGKEVDSQSGNLLSECFMHAVLYISDISEGVEERRMFTFGILNSHFGIQRCRFSKLLNQSRGGLLERLNICNCYL